VLVVLEIERSSNRRHLVELVTKAPFTSPKLIAKKLAELLVPTLHSSLMMVFSIEGYC
jgi:hypothetical protein